MGLEFINETPSIWGLNIELEVSKGVKDYGVNIDRTSGGVDSQNGLEQVLG